MFPGASFKVIVAAILCVQVHLRSQQSWSSRAAGGFDAGYHVKIGQSTHGYNHICQKMQWIMNVSCVFFSQFYQTRWNWNWKFSTQTIHGTRIFIYMKSMKNQPFMDREIYVLVPWMGFRVHTQSFTLMTPKMMSVMEEKPAAQMESQKSLGQ